MNEASSVACPLTAGNAPFAAARDASRSIVRWAVLGAAGIVALALALSHGMSAGAAAPCIQINYTTCVATAGYTVPTYVAPAYVAPTYVAPSYVAPATTSASGYAPNTVVSSYYDPRYGPVSVVTDATGNLIDINSATGQRIYPYAPDYNYGYGFVGGNYVGANYVGGNYAFNGYTGYNGNYGYLNNNVFPAGGTAVGGVVYYNDNRFCGDGKVAFVPSQGYYCQNGGPLVTNGSSSVNCGNFFLNGCGIWRGYEADETTAPAAATQPQQVTAFSAPAAKAPVVAPAAPVVAPGSARGCPGSAGDRPGGADQREGGSGRAGRCPRGRRPDRS